MGKITMEPPKGVLGSLWNFICFLPYFIGLLLLGMVKGIIFCPLICLIMSFGNSAIILGLSPVHGFWTCYSVLRAKQLGPVLKFVLCICVPVLLILWLVIGIAGSILGGILYGFLSPIFATFDAVGEGKTDVFYHCFYDGTWSTVQGSFTVVTDFKDVCFHSYFSIMDELQKKEPPNGERYEIRLLLLPFSIIAAVLGILVDFPVISLVALVKSPYMLFKGWHRLFHDLIGREGPFLETICVPFAGLAILLWPLAVVGAVLGSMVASFFLGAYAAVILYQESSIRFGLSYIVASLAIYDEYSNDILDMSEGSCFPRPQFRKKDEASKPTTSQTSSFSKPSSFSKTASFSNQMVDLEPLKLFESLLKECQDHGETMVSEGLITTGDIEDAKSSKGSNVVSVGLPAYCLLQCLLHSAKANSGGILLSDNMTEITPSNRPKDTFYDWFLNPFLILKEQLKAENLTDAEEAYLGKLVLLCGDPTRLKSSNIGSPPESERKRAELDALARRLQGITKSMSRYPTYRRHFESLVKTLTENLAQKSGDGSRSKTMQRSKSAFARMFSNKSFKGKTGSFNGSSDQESQSVTVRDLEIV